jgi:hypothetical protein
MAEMAEEERVRRAAARRARRAAYFRAYYERHREALLEQHRRWYEAHREWVAELKRRSEARRRGVIAPPEPRACVECGVVVVRAERCERCRARHRYHTDPAYRARRLASARRWRARTGPPPRREEDAR